MFRGVTTLKLKFGPTKTSEFIENSSNKSLSWENAGTSDSQVPKHPLSKNNHLKHPVLNFIGYYLDDFESLPWKNMIVHHQTSSEAPTSPSDCDVTDRIFVPLKCLEVVDVLILMIRLVVSTHLKNISQNGNLPQIGMKIKNI